MPGEIDRRSLLAGGLSLAAFGMLGGAARADDQSLRVAWWGGKDRAERTEKTLALYKSANAGTSISTEYLGWGDYWARLTTETSGGNSPDLVQMSITYLADYASRGVLLDMLPLVPTPLDIKGFQADLVDNGKVDGKLYAVPCGVNVGAIVYDKALYDEAGVTPPGHGTTWEQFAAIMADFSKRTKRQGVFGSPDASGNSPLLETWLRQRGKKLYEADGTLGYDAVDASDWFTMWAEMRASGGARECRSAGAGPWRYRQRSAGAEPGNPLLREFQPVCRHAEPEEGPAGPRPVSEAWGGTGRAGSISSPPCSGRSPHNPRILRRPPSCSISC